MAPGNDSVVHPVTVTAGRQRHECNARIDADCWPARAIPLELTGILELPRAEWQALAAKEHLILTLKSTGEPYRMIIDPGNGRFLARRL
jgi:hypothetical protein